MKKLVTLVAAAALASTGTFGVAVTAGATGTATAASGVASTTSFQQKLERAVARAHLSPELKAKALAIGSRLPAGHEQRLRQLGQLHGIADTPWAQLVNAAIDPDDYVCARTPVFLWLDAQFEHVDFDNFDLLYVYAAPYLPLMDAILLGAESKTNSFGVNGSYTNELNRTMTNLRRFWDINGKGIELMPMKGKKSFSDVHRMAYVLAFMYGDTTPEEQVPTAELIQQLVNADPALRGGDHPWFTFNAMSFDPSSEDPSFVELGVTKRIIMGDGWMEGMAAIGLGDTAPRSTLAHEYGHWVQYAKNLADYLTVTPEGTRRAELMADALGTYFMVHKRGQAINGHQVLHDEQAVYNSGDCYFDEPGHHGTPNQRLAAATWAVSVVKSQPNQGHQVGGVAFGAMFDAALPKIVAPDAR